MKMITEDARDDGPCRDHTVWDWLSSFDGAIHPALLDAIAEAAAAALTPNRAIALGRELVASAAAAFARAGDDAAPWAAGNARPSPPRRQGSAGAMRNASAAKIAGAAVAAAANAARSRSVPSDRGARAPRASDVAAAAVDTVAFHPPPGLEDVPYEVPLTPARAAEQALGEAAYYRWQDCPGAIEAVSRASLPSVSLSSLDNITPRVQPLLAPPEHWGTFRWNYRSDKPAPHIRNLNEIENQGFLGAGNPKSVLRWCRLGGVLGEPGAPAAHITLRNLLEWIKNRPHLTERITDLTAGVPPPGITWGGAGWWLTLKLRPRAVRGTSGAQPTPAPPGPLRRSFHATSMYCVARVAHQGLEEGPARNSNGNKMIGGIFSHVPQRAHLTLGYCHFVPLDTTGNVVGPIMEIQSPSPDPKARPAVLRRNGGNNQCLSYKETTTLVAAHFFVVHVAAFMATGAAAADGRLWIRAETMYNPTLELDPEEDWKSICERSRPANGLPENAVLPTASV